jgi:hypothetical protein
MNTPHTFAIEVLRLFGERLQSKTADLQLLVESGASFEEWLAAEAYLACKPHETAGLFCEVAARPTYGSENVDDDGRPDSARGGLRVGGSSDTTDHRWLFAEFVVLPDSNVEEAITRLKRLGWKKSVAMLVVASANRGDSNKDLAKFAFWNWTTITDTRLFSWPGGSLVVKAFDIKRDPANVIAMSR